MQNGGQASMLNVLLFRSGNFVAGNDDISHNSSKNHCAGNPWFSVLTVISCSLSYNLVRSLSTNIMSQLRPCVVAPGLHLLFDSP